ncbi:hypothetical protein Tco_1114267 [Tanacetum coccineum]|uniref:Uncharacterized protein n=1 Tax=Tanacetum coccineum TaxID=301880 RepID=A0ABQ5IYA4_9ASTR
MTSDANTSGLVPQQQKASDYENFVLVPQLQKNSVHNSTELRIQNHNNEPSSSKLVPDVSSPPNTTDTSLQSMYEDTSIEEIKVYPSLSLSLIIFNNKIHNLH